MAAPTDCGTLPDPADDEEESGDVLKALVLANPADYETENKGACECCQSCPCLGADPDDTFYLTISGACSGMNGDYVLTWDPTEGTSTYDCTTSLGGAWVAISETACSTGARIIFSCDATLGWFIQITTADPVEMGSAPVYGGPAVGVPLCTDPFYLQVTAGPQPVSSCCEGQTLTFTVTKDPGTVPEDCGIIENPWWRVEAGGYPYCDCLQGVTEAVGGPYATEAACLADCGAVEWCAEYQDHDASHNPVGMPYKGCVAGNFTIGDVLHPDSGGSADHRTRTIIDGPFLAGCDCGPCSPPAKDEDDTGCGTSPPPPPPPMAPMVAGAVAKTRPLQMVRSDVASFLKPGTKVGGIPLVAACAHEGAIVDACKTCGDKEGFHVRACSVHGRCTRRTSRQAAIQSCEHCPDYVSPPPDTLPV